MGVFPDENEVDTASSTVSQALDEATDMPDQGGSGADAASSTAEGDKEDVSTLSIVRDVVAGDEGKQTSDAASPAEDEGEGTGEDAGDDAAKDGPDDENYSDVPFNKHPRFKQLIAQRNQYREGARQFDQVSNFIASNNLTSDEAADILVSAALAKTDPVECWKQIKPWVQKVLIAAGEVPPEDLQARVTSGELSADAALELSRAQARARSLEASRQFSQTRDQETRASEHSVRLQNEAELWQNDRAVKDPNFADKLPLVMKELVYLQHSEGKPDTVQGVRAQLQKAYAAANEAYRPPVQQQRPATPSAPRRPAQRPVTGGTVAGTPQAKPSNTLDVIKAVRAARG